jgi:hypothetical protein
VTKCLIENCYYPAAPALKRGLCMRCHGRASAAVKDGCATWDELVGMGLALPESEVGDPFTVALQRKMEGEDAATGPDHQRHMEDR